MRLQQGISRQMWNFQFMRLFGLCFCFFSCNWLVFSHFKFKLKNKQGGNDGSCKIIAWPSQIVMHWSFLWHWFCKEMQAVWPTGAPWMTRPWWLHLLSIPHVQAWLTSPGGFSMSDLRALQLPTSFISSEVPKCSEECGSSTIEW